MTRAHIVEADMEEIKRRAFAAEAELAAARDAADANERKRKDAEGRMEALRSTLRHARDDLGLGWTDRPRPIGKLPAAANRSITDDDAADAGTGGGHRPKACGRKGEAASREGPRA